MTCFVRNLYLTISLLKSSKTLNPTAYTIKIKIHANTKPVAPTKTNYPHNPIATVD